MSLIRDMIRAEWRELGFFYDRDDSSREWRVVGSRAGLLRFSALLRAYAADPRNDRKSEHTHYGPYMYLEVMTWPEAGMDRHAIRGPVKELARLAAEVEDKVVRLGIGETARIREAFTPQSQYALVLDSREDGFDPASADASLPGVDR